MQQFGRSSNLKRLGLAKCNDIRVWGLVKALVKLPLLEELEISHCPIQDLDLRAVGLSCPQLKTLKLNIVDHYCVRSDVEALDIAKTMTGLRHLQLIGNKLSDAGLNAILDCCPHLEHLDLRRCLGVNFFDDLRKRCLERIKDVRRPNDSIADYPLHDFLSHHHLLGEEVYGNVHKEEEEEEEEEEESDNSYCSDDKEEEEDNSYCSDDNEYVY